MSAFSSAARASRSRVPTSSASRMSSVVSSSGASSEEARQWPRPSGGHGVEMALQRLAEGTETTGKPAAVDGHDESHRSALRSTRLVVGAGDVVLDRVIERSLVSRSSPARGPRPGGQQSAWPTGPPEHTAAAVGACAARPAGAAACSPA